MKFKCEEVEQITVFLENRLGILADLCAHLCDRGVNIRAMAVLDGADAGTGRLVADNPDLAKEVLSSAGVAYTTANCLALEMPNNPGGFAGIARTLSRAGVNIDYIYASTLSGTTRALGIFGVSDIERAKSLDWEA
jgi:hypothetical protein